MKTGNMFWHCHHYIYYVVKLAAMSALQFLRVKKSTVAFLYVAISNLFIQKFCPALFCHIDWFNDLLQTLFQPVWLIKIVMLI